MGFEIRPAPLLARLQVVALGPLIPRVDKYHRVAKMSLEGSIGGAADPGLESVGRRAAQDGGVFRTASHVVP